MMGGSLVVPARVPPNVQSPSVPNPLQAEDLEIFDPYPSKECRAPASNIYADEVISSYSRSSELQ